MRHMPVVRAGLAVSAAAAVGFGALAIPAIAGSAPELPGVSAAELVRSVITASPPAFGGTVHVMNGLGLPTLPGLGSDGQFPLAAIPDTAWVWSDGDGRGRIALPTKTGEQTLVEDGDTLWRYDSDSRTATALEHGELPARAAVADPATAARILVNVVRSTSEVTVDGTAEVAGRPAYDLVMTPAARERTLLREVRIAVDSQTRMPLRLDVLTNGSTEPALRIGFTDIEVGPQDADLFSFIPPDGVAVERPDREIAHAPSTRPSASVVGTGWETVMLGRIPAGTGVGGPLAIAAQIGRRASGPWGDGWVVQTAAGTALVASDGRAAAGAVPRQVLDEALAR